MSIARILGSTVLVGSLLGGTETRGGEASFEGLEPQARRDMKEGEGPAYHSALARTYRHKLADGIGYCTRKGMAPPTGAFQAVLVVLSDGKVSQVAVNSSGDVSKCIQERLLRTKLPKPPFAPFHDLMAITFKQE